MAGRSSSWTGWRASSRAGRLHAGLTPNVAERLEALWAEVGPVPAYTILRRPEIGLVMVKGRISGSGAPFCAGEMTVTRAAVRLDNCIHKGKSETVSGRMFSLYEALESPAADIRRESRAIVFDHQFC